MPAASETGNGLRPRVLVVDDERVQADLLAHVLGREGFETRAAYSPQEAFGEARTFRPDVVISDFRMPGATGLDLFEQIIRLRRDTLFIIVTAFGTLETAVEGWFFFLEGAVLRWLERRDLEREELRELLGLALMGSLGAAEALTGVARQP